MGNKSRYTANLVSDNNLFVDITNDRVGVGSTHPTAKLDVDGIKQLMKTLLFSEMMEQ